MTAGRDLQDELDRRAAAHNVPGAALAILHNGEAKYAFHGVTSIENPLPVDESTLFQIGSTGKTYTATAMMRLVEQGAVDLGEKVRTYVPELKLSDEGVAREVTVLHLFNHTAGWEGDLLDNTGDGDDALAKYVELMATLDQAFPLGKAASYNNASLNLAGRVIEKVTNKTYEQAIKELIFEPLGMEHSFFFTNDVMTRRFAVGHEEGDDGTITVARPWAMPRNGNPSGGISCTIGDLVAWARFHLGDGSPLLTKASLDRMKEPTAFMGEDADHVGISWMLKDRGGVRIVEHGGNTVGQNCTFQMIPEHDFAVALVSNAGRGGTLLEAELARWALETFCGVVERDPTPERRPDAELQQYTGTYETIAVVETVTIHDGGLLIKADVRPEVWAKVSDGEVPDQPPFPLGFFDGDRYVVTDGVGKGMRGYFSRDEAGNVDGVQLGGRLAMKTREEAS